MLPGPAASTASTAGIRKPSGPGRTHCGRSSVELNKEGTALRSISTPQASTSRGLYSIASSDVTEMWPGMGSSHGAYQRLLVVAREAHHSLALGAVDLQVDMCIGMCVYICMDVRGQSTFLPAQPCETIALYLYDESGG